MKKVLISGSRSIKNRTAVENALSEYFPNGGVIIIHGGASSGIDKYVEDWCQKYNIQSIIIRPVNPASKIDYLHRNAEMVGMCDECICFWDEVSRGTQFTMEYAAARGKLREVNKFEG